ncbi:DUF2167 domain-containing protein [Ferrimonas balearica]|uniref:DUF2167 domain-containing protein n=1 Tax=Ferrimonas balearica TaxID=44012 RepID=UPI001C98F359|nr:DUF2167 domain-containing protein [Ferrimonas balearica]MBY5993695.1 DUF2167 domain-containing protein [Ferrimonas balearica]
MTKWISVLLCTVSFNLAANPWPVLEQQLEDALAQPQLSAEEIANIQHIRTTLAPLSPQQGSVQIAQGRVQLEVPEQYYYFSPDDAEAILVEIWGNVPGTGSETLGLLMPADLDPLEDASWAATLYYVHDGHVKDDDAASIDYDELLVQMKEETAQSSQLRVEQGYDAMELIGWATRPYYDAESRKLHWAKELQFARSEGRTLNYDIRILGREGFLQMGFIATMDQLAQLQSEIPGVLALANFTPNNRYADFDPDLDNVAAYGIGGLIAGKALAKTGVFAAILMILKKFWFVIAAAIWGLFKALGRALRPKGAE